MKSASFSLIRACREGAGAAGVAGRPVRSRGRAALRYRASRWLLVMLAMGCLAGPCATAHEPAAARGGPLVLVGGVLRYDNEAVWSRLVTLSGGEGARWVVIPAATGRAAIYGGFAVRGLEARGAEARLLPIAVDASEFGRDHREAVRDPGILGAVLAADGVFFTGGSPQRTAQVLYERDGSATPLLAALRELHLAGGVIAGANPGQRVASTAIPAAGALADGLPGQALTAGLGLLEPAWYLDQHLFVHRRLAVGLAAMRGLGLQRGLGVGVNAAVIIEDDVAEIVGREGALLLELPAETGDSGRAGHASSATGAARRPQPRSPVPLEDVRVSFLAAGDRLELDTLRVLPSPAKRGGYRIDPDAADHEPWLTGPAFHPDPFNTGALRALLFNALDGQAGESIGLVLQGAPAQAAGGFRFRFHPGPDTHGWLSGDGRGDYTVIDLHLDVSPATAGDLRGARSFFEAAAGGLAGLPGDTAAARGTAGEADGS